MEVVSVDGEVMTTGGAAPDPSGYDLRGLVIGLEGTLAIATRILVRLTSDPPGTGFDTVIFRKVHVC